MGQMDFMRPQTVWNEICLKCRDTIPLVEVWFELSLTVFKLESNFESTIEFFSTFYILAVFFLISQQDDAEMI